ncbi:TBC1 domain family member 7 [Trichogramma pretiosum]|uniref:TBC1 domain family member 7 n=1 Tax=Trichogramma pretiosum TaxID=7493 RepID=UPI0006C94858|nr:TBC1 domain family member 7 [Trichogramma pretiosum]
MDYGVRRMRTQFTTVDAQSLFIAKTMDDQRNFRSSYYEKVGFRSVEEKKSLEMLLRDRPFDKAKLKQFCLRFTVPAIYRNFLWKILLDVIPPLEESHKFVMTQRTIEFNDLQRALKVVSTVDETTKPSEIFLLMWLLKNRRSKIDIRSQLETPMLRSMNKMAVSLWNISEDLEEDERLVNVYWILSGFIEQVQKFSNEIGRLQECTYTMLEREDKELYNHLKNTSALQTLPFDVWFMSCFAGIISDGSITKIWDKITVGACRILIFVAIAMLTTLKRCIISQCQNTDQVVEVINHITEETSEVIVNKAIECWQQSGSVMLQNQNTLPHS